MFGKRIHLFNLFGFSVKIDLSWLILLVLIVWSLAAGAFPQWFAGHEEGVYWLMGLAGAGALFVSIVWHELCHSLVARYYGMPMKGITLWLFGGVAEMDEEPPNARAEFLMAIAGPISSVVLAFFAFAGVLAARGMGWPRAAGEVLLWAGWINIVLAIFNMVPGFPLDGGRVLRAALWHWRGDLRWATRMASQAGSAFGAVLIALGILQILSGVNAVGGLWWILIGMFLRGAAKQGYQHLLVRRMLEGEPVRRFMNDAPVSLPPSLTLRRLADDYLYKHHHKRYPVVDEEERLLGCMDMRKLKDVPRGNWDEIRVESLTAPCGGENALSPDADAMDALSRMRARKIGWMMVVEDGRLAGVLTLQDLLEFLSLKMELDEDVEPREETITPAG